MLQEKLLLRSFLYTKTLNFMERHHEGSQEEKNINQQTRQESWLFLFLPLRNRITTEGIKIHLRRKSEKCILSANPCKKQTPEHNWAKK